MTEASEHIVKSWRSKKGPPMTVVYRHVYLISVVELSNEFLSRFLCNGVQKRPKEKKGLSANNKDLDPFGNIHALYEQETACYYLFSELLIGNPIKDIG